MRAIDKLDRLGISGVQQLLGDGRKDEKAISPKVRVSEADDIALVVGVRSKPGDADTMRVLRDSKIRTGRP